jgi:stearoyl-CoA desaturase (delta-9 desaturase)
VKFLGQANLASPMVDSKMVIRWPMVIYLGGLHILGIFAFPYLLRAHTATLIFAFLFYVLGGLGITVGAHRLWAHRTYKAEAPFRVLLMLCNSIANQGSIFHWCRDHRVHQ